VAKIEATELAEKISSLSTFEMDQAGYRALREFGEGWSDPTEQVRAVLAAMLAAADKKFFEEVLAILQ
jgi:hypothetical protein